GSRVPGVRERTFEHGQLGRVPGPRGRPGPTPPEHGTRAGQRPPPSPTHSSADREQRARHRGPRADGGAEQVREAGHLDLDVHGSHEHAPRGATSPRHGGEPRNRRDEHGGRHGTALRAVRTSARVHACPTSTSTSPAAVLAVPTLASLATARTSAPSTSARSSPATGNHPSRRPVAAGPASAASRSASADSSSVTPTP